MVLLRSTPITGPVSSAMLIAVCSGTAPALLLTAARARRLLPASTRLNRPIRNNRVGSAWCRLSDHRRPWHPTPTLRTRTPRLDPGLIRLLRRLVRKLTHGHTDDRLTQHLQLRLAARIVDAKEVGMVVVHPLRLRGDRRLNQQALADVLEAVRMLVGATRKSTGRCVMLVPRSRGLRCFSSTTAVTRWYGMPR